MDEFVRLEINKRRSYIDFMLSQQQWSGITKTDVDKWLSNFRGISSQEMLLVYDLLSNLIYYSEKDIISALREGVEHQLFVNIILGKQIESGFRLSQHALSNIAKEELSKTCFIPLLDSDAPFESGNYVTRLLVQQQFVTTSQSMFLSKIVTPFEQGAFSRLVIVDDCIGSGAQLRNFWRDSATLPLADGNNVLLRDFCRINAIETIYLALFGYDKTVTTLSDEFTDLRICCIRKLNDTQRVFSDASYIWPNAIDRRNAIQFFSEITKEHGLPLLGYNDLDFAFIMHQTIPDWSLPLLWKENPDWNLLLRRKNSNV